MTDVLAWADQLSVHSYEVFVRYEDHALEARGNWVTVVRYARVHGAPADDGGTSETVILTRK